MRRDRCPDCGGPRWSGWWHTLDCPERSDDDDRDPPPEAAEQSVRFLRSQE